MAFARLEPDTRPLPVQPPPEAWIRRPDGAAPPRSGASARGLALAALCVAMVVIETGALLGMGAARSTLALAPQVAAPAPWGVFHDERWLLVNAGSWPVVILGALAIVAGRGALTAVMVKLAWPAVAAPMPWRTALVRGWTSTAVAALLLSPSASMLVAFALAPISDLWLAAMPAALGIAIFIHHGTVDSWWLRHPRVRSIGWIVVSYLELTVAGATVTLLPRGWTPVLAVLAGVVDASLWQQIVRALARPAALRYAPISLLGVASVVAVVAASASVLSAPSTLASTAPRAPAAQAADAPGSTASALAAHDPVAAHRSVLLVSGYGVRWSGAAPSLGPGFSTQEFSYRGIDPGGRPLPYSSSATQASLPVLVGRFRAQVNALARKSGGHIDIVGESEGSLLATIYLLTTPHPPVDHVVLLSPLVRPSGASYPPADAEGPGLAAAWELRGVAGATNALTPLSVSADSAFINSLGAHGNALRDAFGCPVAGVQQFAILPLADAVGVPPQALTIVPHETVVALHGTLLVDPVVRYDIANYLDGTALPTAHDNGLASLAAAASAAWQAPPRRLPADPPTAIACRDAATALRAWLG
jgi:hypothetical protein